MATSATRFGVTYNFSADRTVVNSVLGEPCVIRGDAFNITSITPDYVSTSGSERNGFQVNPTTTNDHGWDSRISAFNASLVPSLPLAAEVGQSIIKCISLEAADIASPTTDTFGSGSSTRLREAAVLSVIDTDPGEPFFRPPMFGDTEKPIHLVSEVNESLLEDRSTTNIDFGGRDLAWAERRFARTQLDIKPLAAGRVTRPWYQMSNYDGFLARDVYEAMLLCHLDLPIADKRPVVYGLIQYGIDLYYTHKHSTVQMHGSRKMTMLFAAYMLESTAMLEQVRDWAVEGRFYEDQRYQQSELVLPE